jgi:hypothetical protein
VIPSSKLNTTRSMNDLNPVMSSRLMRMDFKALQRVLKADLPPPDAL